MKKAILSILILLLLFCFSTCSLIEKDIDSVRRLLSYPVCVSAVIEREPAVRFKLYVYENETMFTFTEPSILCPFTVKKNNEGYYAQYDGIETEIDRIGVMAADALDIALETVRSSTECEQQSQSGQNVLLFSIDGNNVLVYYNKDNGVIDKIISEAYGQLFSYEILSVESIQT